MWPKLGWAIATEEGLATLNTFRHYSDARLWGASINYIAAWFSFRMSFAELYVFLAKYIDTRERIWKVCMRVKRGVGNTSLAIGFAKDQCSLDGALRILALRNRIDFRTLHLSKSTLEENDVASRMVSRGRGLNATSPLRDPWFYTIEEDYKKSLEKISRDNGVVAHLPATSLRCTRVCTVAAPQG